jgi:hypothetical protein
LSVSASRIVVAYRPSAGRRGSRDRGCDLREELRRDRAVIARIALSFSAARTVEAHAELYRELLERTRR